MNRRTLLGTTAATLTAGCHSLAPSSNVRSGDGRRPYPHVSISNASIEPAHDLSLDVEVVGQFGDDAPATLAIELENAGNETRAFQTGPSPPLDPTVGHRVGGNGRLIVVPPDGTGYAVLHEVPEGSRIDVDPPEADERLVPQEPTGSCWRGQYEPLSVYLMARGATLDPSESIARRYVLVAHPENDSCLPAGSYEITDDAEIDDEAVTLEVGLEISRNG